MMFIGSNPSRAMPTGPTISRVEHDRPSDASAARPGARYSIASLLMAVLTIVLVVGAHFVGSELDAVPFSVVWYGLERTYLRQPPPIQHVLEGITRGAGILPFIGLALARRARSNLTKPTAVGSIALVASSFLAFLTGLVVVVAFWQFVVMAKVEGVFLINKYPAQDTILYLRNAKGRTETTTTQKDGSFTFHGLSSGNYALTAASQKRLPLCVDVTSDNALVILSQSPPSYMPGVWVRVGVKVSSWPFTTVTRDIKLDC